MHIKKETWNQVHSKKETGSHTLVMPPWTRSTLHAQVFSNVIKWDNILYTCHLIDSSTQNYLLYLQLEVQNENY